MKKNLGVSILVVIISLGLFSFLSAQSNETLNEFAGGSGTEADPWQIATAEHLNNLRNYLGDEHNDKFFIQISDIELGTPPWNEGQGWLATGSYHNPFCGHYDGNGFVITGMMINRSMSSYQGLFGYTKGAVIENLGLTNVDVYGNEYVGALVGYNFDNSLINNCFSTGNISGNSHVGGLIGHNSYSTVNSSYSAGIVNGFQSNCGGLIGLGTYQALSNSYSRAVVSGNSSVGGLVGYQFRGTMINCYAAGLVTGSQNVGGLTGQRITLGGYLDLNNYWDIETSGQSNSAMGMGRTTAEMTYPYDPETYLDWNFGEIWGADEDYEINDGYPYLRGVSYVSAENTYTLPGCSLRVSNYPNPFYSETAISFSLRERGPVELVIFNVKGKLVRKLSGIVWGTGEQMIIWNGIDDHGNEVPSGVYFYRLVAGRDGFFGKMLFVR